MPRSTPSEVSGQRILKLGGVRNNRRLEFLKLLYPPFDRQRRARAEKLALGGDDFLYFFFGV